MKTVQVHSIIRMILVNSSLNMVADMIVEICWNGFEFAHIWVADFVMISSRKIVGVINCGVHLGVFNGGLF